MGSSPRLGLTVGLDTGPLRSAVAVCRDAEQMGYTDMWSAEVGGADGLSPLAAIAATTSKVRLGTAILPVFTRPPALLAMSAATLQDLSDGRFVLGLGTSSSIIVERWMGTSFEKPLERERTYIELIRRMLAGDKVDSDDGIARVKSFRLQTKVEKPVPLYLAALGPRACRMAGEIADGVIFFLKTPAGVKQSLEWVADGARSAGRDPADIEAVIRIPVIVDQDDADAVQMAARWMVVSYGMVDVYNRSLHAQGYEDDARKIKDAWASGDKGGAMQAVSSELLEELLVFGDKDARVSKIDAFRNAGIDTPVVLPVSVVGDDAQKAQRVLAAVEELAPG
jgi:probable F420-dependent oxidoreductase